MTDLAALQTFSLFLSFRFMGCYLRTDGMVVLRLIRLNMGVNTTTEIILDVFNRFKEMDDKLRFSDSTSVSTCSASSESAY